MVLLVEKKDKQKYILINQIKYLLNLIKLKIVTSIILIKTSFMAHLYIIS